MRSGTAQQSSAANPLITVTVDSDVYKSEGGGGNERVVRVRTDEQAWGGEYLIELDNDDETLSAKNYEGEQVTLNLSFIGESADNFHPLWVVFQEDTSVEGKLRVVLHCGDVWAFIAAHNVTLVNASFNQEWQTAGGLAGRQMPDKTLITEAQWSDLYNDLVARGDKHIWEIIQYLGTATGVTITKTDTDSYVTSLKPPISIGNARVGLRQLMDYTESYLKLTSGGGLTVWQSSNHASVYTYDDLDVPFSDGESVGVTIPNKIVVWAFNEAGSAWHSGEAVDSVSYGKLGQYISRHYLVASLDNGNKKSEADLDALAEGILAKVQAELNQGYLVAPMHCTQELFDKITVVDDRYATPRTIIGYVNRMIREYDRGVYRITIHLGGVTSGWTPPGGEEAGGLAGAPPPFAPSSFPFEFLPAYLPVVIDVDFTAVDHDTVSWGSGTIKAANGTVWDINSGQLDLVNADVYYLYYDTVADTGDLENTQTFGNTISHERILVGFLKKVPAGEKALIVIGSQGPDLFIDVLSAITANLGLVNAGEIRVGSGTLGVDFTGFRMWLEAGVGRIAGYQNDVLQYYTGSDGKLYAGGGKVLLDSNGVHIDSAGGANLLQWIYDSFYARLWLSSYGELVIDGEAGVQIQYNGGARVWSFRSDGEFRPAANTYSLGSSSYPWGKGYFKSRLKIPVGTDMYD